MKASNGFMNQSKLHLPCSTVFAVFVIRKEISWLLRNMHLQIFEDTDILYVSPADAASIQSLPRLQFHQWSKLVRYWFEGLQKVGNTIISQDSESNDGNSFNPTISTQSGPIA